MEQIDDVVEPVLNMLSFRDGLDLYYIYYTICIRHDVGLCVFCIFRIFDLAD